MSHLADLDSLKLYVTLPVYLNLITGLLYSNPSNFKNAVKKNSILINTQRVEVLELKIKAKELREKRVTKYLSWVKIKEDSTIDIFALNQMFLIGCWKSAKV